MRYLNYIYNLLNLSNSVGIETNNKQRQNITISIKKINKISIIVYLLFILIVVAMSTGLYITAGTAEDEAIILRNINIKAITIIPILVITISTAYVLIKRYIILKTKESKPCNINIYNRDLPDKLTPAHVRILIEDGVIDDKSVASTILDLIDRGYLKLESENRNELFSKNLYISVTDKPQNDLFHYEKYMIDWFFENNRISSEDLHKKLNDASEIPSEKFAIFQGLVLASFPLNKYYKKYNNTKQKIYIAFVLILFLSFFILNAIQSPILLTIFEFFPIFGIANLLFASPTYLLNDTGSETRDSYLDLKKYLEDFSTIHTKTSEMIVLWNHYLSYSVALGINGIASNEIKNFFGKEVYNKNYYNGQVMEDNNIRNLIDNTQSIIEYSEQLYNKK